MARWIVESPHLPAPVFVLVARGISYLSDGNTRQNFSVYLPQAQETSHLVDQPAVGIPALRSQGNRPQWHVHIHGGAWRDPQLTSASIAPAVAHAFSDPQPPITAIISINYTLSPFPTHPTLPYEPAKNGKGKDSSRDAKHPDHIRDVLTAFKLLRQMGLVDGSYILSGHSCGACLAFQAILQVPQHWGLDLPTPPRPAALIGLNGLYDLPKLVHGLGASHEHLSGMYEDLIGIAFGPDQTAWPAASPARVDVGKLAQNVKDGSASKLVLVDQSDRDQLVPMNEADIMEAQLKEVDGLRVVRGHRCSGLHAAPWEGGNMIWKTVMDVWELL